ncbi:MAG: hypothetical protein ACP5N1_02000 [Candidatus Woesearchaeota archaeon]
MENTLESTIVFSLGKDKEKDFETITTKLGKQMSDSVPNSRGYDVWINKERNEGYIRQRSGDSKSMINYLSNVLKKNIPELQKTGRVTHNYLFGTSDKEVMNSAKLFGNMNTESTKTAEMITNGGIKPSTYDRHFVSIADQHK